VYLDRWYHSPRILESSSNLIFCNSISILGIPSGTRWSLNWESGAVRRDILVSGRKLLSFGLLITAGAVKSRGYAYPLNLIWGSGRAGKLTSYLVTSWSTSRAEGEWANTCWIGASSGSQYYISASMARNRNSYAVAVIRDRRDTSWIIQSVIRNTVNLRRHRRVRWSSRAGHSSWRAWYPRRPPRSASGESPVSGWPGVRSAHKQIQLMPSGWVQSNAGITHRAEWFYENLFGKRGAQIFGILKPQEIPKIRGKAPAQVGRYNVSDELSIARQVGPKLSLGRESGWLIMERRRNGIIAIERAVIESRNRN